MYSIDLNCDMGESFGAYTLGMDKEIAEYITSANVACGFHASDPVTMEKTAKIVKEAGVAMGAHPGYPDLMGFGRRNMNASPAEVKAYMLYQMGALSAFATAKGMKLHHVKPHGAMYNMAGKDEKLAKAICEAVKEFDPEITLLALSGSCMVTEAEKMGLKVAKEVFADRAYEADGSLVARSKEGAMITDEDEAVERVLRMIKEGKVKAIDGSDIPIQADSVCVHGDSPKALLFVKKLSDAIKKEGISLKSFA